MPKPRKPFFKPFTEFEKQRLKLKRAKKRGRKIAKVRKQLKKGL